MLSKVLLVLRRLGNTLQRSSGRSDGDLLRQRSPLILGGALLGVIGILYATSSTILLNSFVEVEEQSVQQNIEQVLDGLFTSSQELDATTRDYATWDDTYAFAKTADQRFIRSNFDGATFTALHLNLVVLLDASNHIIFAKGFDLNSKAEMAAPKELASYLKSDPILLHHPTLTDSHTGIILLSNAPLLVASRPILTSQGKGPIRGTLLMGRNLNPTEVEKLSRTTHLSIALYSVHSIQRLPADIQAAYSALSASARKRRVVAPLTSDRIAGYTLFRGIDGNPALLLQITLPRPIYQQGLVSLRYLQFSLLLIGAVFGAIVWLLLKSLVLYLAERDRIQKALLQEKELAQTMAQQLSWQANYDGLTGLLNRREFEQRLEQALADAKLHNREHSLCFLDLDHFKTVNDTCGHVAGDELLRQVSALLQQTVRKADTVARLGGDEFAVLLYQCSTEQALHLAQKICLTVQGFQFIWKERVFTIGSSIGLAAVTASSTSSGQVLNAADLACYVAKNRGRGQVCAFQSSDNQSSDKELMQQRSEMHWVTQINRAIEENRLQLYYQTIAPLKAEHSRRTCCEVLLRLIDEQGEIILPSAFIPAAERHNLMLLLDRWVIRTLFARLSEQLGQTWMPDSVEGYSHLYTINLSGSSLNDNQFISFLSDQLKQYRIPPQMICFEIAEAVTAANLSKATQLIRAFKALGCYFALDDFGRGLSSFASLRNLPIDFLKIDGEFVREIVADPVALVLVQAINQIGQVMGLQTIAEFVANEEIQQQIIALGVDYAQGYQIAPPRPLRNIEQ